MKPETISSEEFDRRFDAGEDMADYIDWTRTGPPISSISSMLHLPEAVMVQLGVEAQRRGLSREQLIERWLTERRDNAA